MGGIHCFAIIAKKVASRGIHSFAKAKKATLTKPTKKAGNHPKLCFSQRRYPWFFLLGPGKGEKPGEFHSFAEAKKDTLGFFTLFKEGTLGVVLHPFLKKDLGLVFCTSGFIRATFLVKARDAPPRSWMATSMVEIETNTFFGGKQLPSRRQTKAKDMAPVNFVSGAILGVKNKRAWIITYLMPKDMLWFVCLPVGKTFKLKHGGNNLCQYKRIFGVSSRRKEVVSSVLLWLAWACH